jgi:hypothetical protein
VTILNGKIEKLKDNIGNYIFPITSSKCVYMADGTTSLDKTLTDIIHQPALNAISTQINDMAINVKTFGAKGDGIADDTQAFINMFNYVSINYLTNYVKIVIPFGTYKITQDIIINRFENKIFEFIGNLIFVGCNAFEFKHLLNSKITANRIEGYKFVYDSVGYTTLVYSGLKFTNCAYNNISITQIVGFKNGIWLYGVSGGYTVGTFYNSINFQSIYRCYNGIVCSSDELTGWVNENTFTGGGIDAINGIVQGDIINNGSANFHNQKYINIGFEQIRGGVGVLFNEGCSNVILHPRFEGGGTPLYHIKEGNQASKNKYITSKYTMEISMISLNPNGKSEVEADLRINTNPVATKMKSVEGNIIYESNWYNVSTPNNTLINEYNQLNLFTFKNNLGKKKTLGYYEEHIFVENISLLNGFINFSSTPDSSYSKLYYYRTGNNELVIGGYITGGVKNADIFLLPAAYRPKIFRHTFPITMYIGTGLVAGFVEIGAGGAITMMSEVIGANRICLDGIRLSLDY